MGRETASAWMNCSLAREITENEMQCPKCNKIWPADCEQTLCIERHGECIGCRFVPAGENNQFGSGSGTEAEFDALRILPANAR